MGNFKKFCVKATASILLLSFSKKLGFSKSVNSETGAIVISIFFLSLVIRLASSYGEQWAVEIFSSRSDSLSLIYP